MRNTNKILKPTDTEKEKSVKLFFLKLVFLLCIVGAFIYYTDRKSLFNEYTINDNSSFRWNCFYAFTRITEVDVLLVGNSRVYNGVEPINLSLSLGANSFILASGGTNIADVYWSLKEALRRCKPKLVILETYPIQDLQMRKLKDNHLSYQFKSFSARKDFVTKLISTPDLFNRNQYIPAWSNTIRNHNFIFDDPTQIMMNLLILKNKINIFHHVYKNRLYLGQCVRENTGMSDSVLSLYKVKGPNYDGTNFHYSKDAEVYLDKICSLCHKNNIEMMFLTVPVYNKNMINYIEYKKTLARLISKYPYKWLDLQEEKNYKNIGFNRYTFENTYNIGQHLNYNGSILLTSMLAKFIKDSIKTQLPNRRKEPLWNIMYYGQESYFSYFSPHKNDSNASIICTSKKLRNCTLKEALIVKKRESNTRILLVKINKEKLQSMPTNKMKLVLEIVFRDKFQDRKTILILHNDNLFTNANHYTFFKNINNLEVVKVIDGIVM